jgi:predicted AlkP superfamily phosphohydrolase/phosphomutase
MTAILMPLCYVGVSAWIEWRNFSRAPAIGYLGATVLAAVISGVALASMIAVLDRLDGRRSAWRVVQTMVAGLATAGFVVLPFRSFPLKTPVSEARSLERLPDHDVAAPVLFIAVDGASWETIRPLLAQGRLPTLARLMADGTHGDVRAEWPPYWSAPAWGAMLTGHSRDQVGVHEDLVATAPGLPPFEVSLTLNPALDPVLYAEFVLTSFGLVRPDLPGRAALHQPPVWELLSRSGVRTAVIRFPFTFPADNGADLIVSELMSTDLWEAAGVRRHETGQFISPEREAARVMEWMADADRAHDRVFHAILPSPPQRRLMPARKVGAEGLLRQLLGLDDIAHSVIGLGNDPAAVLDELLWSDLRAFEVAEQTIGRDPRMKVTMIYIAGFDLVCHAFWQYRFPEAYPTRPPRPDDVARLGPVIDRYLEFIDQGIARLIEAYRSAPNVIVLSDHGQEASLSNPLWFGTHSARGVFIAAGPDISRDDAGVQVSYYDVAPTLLDLQNLEKPADMVGTSVLAQAADLSPHGHAPEK